MHCEYLIWNPEGSTSTLPDSCVPIVGAPKGKLEHCPEEGTPRAVLPSRRHKKYVKKFLCDKHFELVKDNTDKP
jgi:hypothetical protein